MVAKTVSIKSIGTSELGTLSFFEAERDIPFQIKRIYYIYGVPNGGQRGGHAHKKLSQILFCPYGSITIKLDDGSEKCDIILDHPNKGLIVEHNIWRDMIWNQADSVLCVAASEYYDEKDYIRDYGEFKKYICELEDSNSNVHGKML